ncbi:cell wall hydrolase, SleB [Novosphingobium nitrogenifigens DSM 19370]|uniref:Cell wall hydrolase, SleB n=1 Tax=Novosphingobium nitrogenifigens DSM 19370 TaxID=983920 RepID=F1ZBG3_9SPHN|nr:cell wall hydrolase [Novosphingobium nitrogenifigens]EGD58139.1 cell wall hydrolase, SleB [Novosphingobium nitrogenifigens DSM 19370]
MPLEIAYPPVVLPPAPPRGTDTGEQDGSGADQIPPLTWAPTWAPAGDARPRDFVARIRRRDMTSLRRQLHRTNRLRRRALGIVVVGLMPVILAMLGWGDPRGIRMASAQDQVATGEALFGANPARTAWERTLASIHNDADTTPANPETMPHPIMLAGTGQDRWRALQCLTTAIYYEAAREPDEGQRAVAQVVLNRVAHPAFPKTVCGVVYQGSERPGCQFSFACDGSLARAPMAIWWDRARRVAQSALAGNVYTPIGLATHYHTSAVHPTWADSMTFLRTIGAHRFYRWSGSAGQPQAFAAVYSGGEPVAAPHPRTWVSTGADIADPIALEKAFEAGRLAALRAATAPQEAEIAPASASAPPPPVANAAFGQQPLPHATDAPHSANAPTSQTHTPPGSGTVRPDYQQQYDDAARWIRQPGT